MNRTKTRKLEHVKICSESDVEAKQKSTGFEFVDFVHQALPEIDKNKIDLSTNFLGKKLNYPIIIEAMTGGHEKAEKINKNLAKAAQKLGLGFGVGSQRAMLENPKLAYTYQIRDVAPDILLIGNLGVPQIRKYGIEKVQECMDKIGADLFAIHLNSLQEAIQEEGETDTKGFSGTIAETASKSKIPILIKETGAGISREAAQVLIKTKIAGIDVGGAGGTSFAAVEAKRTGTSTEFWDWGIPTAASLLEVRSVSKSIPIIASGGIRTGLDIAKSLALGADCAGLARPLLEPAKKSSKDVVNKLNELIDELRTAMFLTGSKNIKELKKKQLILSGTLLEWTRLRKITI